MTAAARSTSVKEPMPSASRTPAFAKAPTSGMALATGILASTSHRSTPCTSIAPARRGWLLVCAVFFRFVLGRVAVTEPPIVDLRRSRIPAIQRCVQRIIGSRFLSSAPAFNSMGKQHESR